jgi:hypothetical protein
MWAIGGLKKKRPAWFCKASIISRRAMMGRKRRCTTIPARAMLADLREGP